MYFILKGLHQKNKSVFVNKVRIGCLLICLSFTQFSVSQILKDVDEIFPFQGELAAIKKGEQWAFINSNGVKVIDFRNDLVATKEEVSSKTYPLFKEGKCLIRKKIDGVFRYGYIDKTGKTVIEPTYLNATNFKDGKALVIKLEKKKMGSNSILGKSITNTKIEEYVIDASGKQLKYLENSRGYQPSKTSPKINAKFISPNLVAVKTLNGKWTLHKL